jgi:hypothetical protein
MRKKESKRNSFENIPASAAKFIKIVIKKMMYRRNVREDVQAELISHFEDELHDCKSDQEKQRRAEQLICDFGDAKLLAVLMRRAKKRCRPVWKKILVRSLHVFGVTFLYILICTSPMIIGRPTIKVNYIDWLNEFVQADRNESDNARPYYDKAANLYAEMPYWMVSSYAEWPTDFNDTELKSLSNWLESNKDAFEMLRTATERPYYWSRYQKSTEVESIKGRSTEGFVPDLMKSIIPDLMKSFAGYRPIALAMREQIRYEAYIGNVDEALRDCVVLVKFGDHLRGRGLLTEQLIGSAIEALGHGRIFEVLEKVDVPPEALKNTQQELRNQFRKEKQVIRLEAEKVFWYDQIQRSFTDDGQGSGRVLARGVPYATMVDWKDSLWRFLTFSYPSRREIVAQIERYFNKADELIRKTPHSLYISGVAPDNWSEVLHTNLAMLREQGLGYNILWRLGWRLKTNRSALLTLLAIMRYQKEQRKYPASLDELVEADYLDELPIDPFADKPLVYKKMKDNFILYSVGLNFTDDGGKVVRDDKGRLIRMWSDQGDWVFWPVYTTNKK